MFFLLVYVQYSIRGNAPQTRLSSRSQALTAGDPGKGNASLGRRGRLGEDTKSAKGLLVHADVVRQPTQEVELAFDEAQRPLGRGEELEVSQANLLLSMLAILSGPRRGIVGKHLHP